MHKKHRLYRDNRDRNVYIVEEGSCGLPFGNAEGPAGVRGLVVREAGRAPHHLRSLVPTNHHVGASFVESVHVPVFTRGVHQLGWHHLEEIPGVHQTRRFRHVLRLIVERLTVSQLFLLEPLIVDLELRCRRSLIPGIRLDLSQPGIPGIRRGWWWVGLRLVSRRLRRMRRRLRRMRRRFRRIRRRLRRVGRRLRRISGRLRRRGISGWLGGLRRWPVRRCLRRLCRGLRFRRGGASAVHVVRVIAHVQHLETADLITHRVLRISRRDRCAGSDFGRAVDRRSRRICLDCLRCHHAILKRIECRDLRPGLRPICIAIPSV